MTEPRIAFVLKGYPRLSETFIAQEIRALELAGLDLLIVSLRHPTDKRRHPTHDEIEARVHYLPEYLHQEPLRVLRGWWRARRAPGYRRAWRSWMRDLRRDRTRNRIRRFGQAMVLFAELPGSVEQLHAHFMHTPGSVTRYCAQMLDWPWSFSAHARDIWTTDQWELREKLDDCEWGVTCTASNLEYLQSLCAKPGKLELLYHGLDLKRFPHFDRTAAMRDGSDARHPVRLLSVGRAVEKKGYDVLLKALARLPDSLHWQLEHVGGGELTESLKSQADELGIGERIQWHGALAQAEVLACYRRVDLFVLASKLAADGDRDGLPNVIVEAQSQGLACVSTAVSAIPELLEDGVNGLLVPGGDTEAMTEALRKLIVAPSERERMGQAGEAIVRANFDLHPGVRRLVERFTTGASPQTLAGESEDRESSARPEGEQRSRASA